MDLMHPLKLCASLLWRYPYLGTGSDLEFVQNKAPKVTAADMTPAAWPADAMLSFWSRCLLLLAVSGASALRIDGALRRPASAAASLVPFMQAAPQIAKPKTQIKHSTGYSTGDGGGQGGAGAGVEIAKPKRKAHTEEVPLWKVILLGDEEYIEDEVCPVLVAIIPDIENDRQAKEKYDEAESTGKSMLIVVPKEHAEAYVEQLIRAEPMVYAEIEEE